MQGKTINGFTLQRLLGVGGMAEVWYAENEIGLKAAVKILAEKLSHDDQMRERFLNEAKVMVQLDHPNIRRVYGYGNIDGRPTIIMEYLEGSDLKARLKQGQRFSQEELERWWNQLVSALDYTHRKGIVHRDIKPGNIFVDEEGNAKLLDFGIAKVADTTTGTLTGSTLGTRIYMSPEQVRDPKRVGPSSDSYSLAVTFVHLLTGKAPYDNSNSSDYDIQVSIVTKPIDMSEVPADWQGFLSPYLEKDPAKRPALKPFETEGIIKTTGTTITTGTPRTTEGIITTGTTKTTETTETSDDRRGIKTTGTTQTTDEEGTLVDVPPVKPTVKSSAMEEDGGSKNKKWLWIGLGITAVVALTLLLLLKPKDTSVKHPAKSGGDDDEQFEVVMGSFGGHEYVNLGLPSGTLWATCNIGTDKPEGYGNYYAWGETRTKTTYDWTTYKYADGDRRKLKKYCNESYYGVDGFTDNLTSLQNIDDPAAVNWGSGWRTPTKEQWEELFKNTTHNNLATQNGVRGCRLTSKKNGQSLFLPYADSNVDGKSRHTGSEGYYWSLSLDTHNSDGAWGINVNSSYYDINSYIRCIGFSVRPVRDN